MSERPVENTAGKMLEPNVTLELPGDVKNLEELHLLSPLPSRSRHRRHSSFDGGGGRGMRFSSGAGANQVSLTAAEAVVLHRLLIDEPPSSSYSSEAPLYHERFFNDEILFSVPFVLPRGKSAGYMRWSRPPKPKRPSILGLWKAHAAGFAPKLLTEKKKRVSRDTPIDVRPTLPAAHASNLASARTLSGTIFHGTNTKRSSELARSVKDNRGRYRRARSEVSASVNSSADYDEFCPSDEEVRPNDDDSEDISWSDGEQWGQFDAWEILKDEYASDFGFETHASPSSFLILGTSPEDTAAHPHVMSPPLMDALTNHFPPSIQGDNFWLKFSLVRDGANLDTLTHYVRSSEFTIIAIETDRGEVFGSFTSTPWRSNFGFFGGPPAFVWKMRSSRQTKCSSLFEQARLESQIDVYPYSGKLNLVQACRRNLLAVGGDDMKDESLVRLTPALAAGGRIPLDRNGFAFALEEDLLKGTTSPCSTFQSPALCGSSGDSTVFFTSGVEVWTLTPCRDVDAAEKMEMTRFFIEHSTRGSPGSSIRSSSLSPTGSTHASTRWGSRELNQEEFFRRVGHDVQSEERRQLWQDRNGMDGDLGRTASGDFGRSPRFGFRER